VTTFQVIYQQSLAVVVQKNQREGPVSGEWARQSILSQVLSRRGYSPVGEQTRNGPHEKFVVRVDCKKLVRNGPYCLRMRGDFYGIGILIGGIHIHGQDHVEDATLSGLALHLNRSAMAFYNLT
jgi:hypothetical protein